MTSPHAESEGRGASLGAFDIGCVVVGGIIGVGIFFTPSEVARAVQEPWQVILAWGLGGFLAVLGALVFAELSALVPGHGGTFLYIQKAFGRLPAFLYGWANWLVIQAGALCIIGLVLMDNLDVLIFGEQRMQEHTKVALAVLAMLSFTGINVLGLRFGRGVQNTLTVLKVLAVFGLVLLSWFTAGEGIEDAPVREEPRPLVGMLAAAMLPVLFATGGWQQGSFLAGAVRRPLRDVPIGILGGVAVVVLAYVTVNLAYLDLLGFSGARESRAIGADAARAALGDAGGRVLAGMVVVSAMGIMNTICMAPPYVLHAMSRQGLFPAAVGRLHGTFGTPVLAVLGQGLWAVVLLVGVHGLTGSKRSLEFLLSGVVFVDWLFYGLCGLALFRLRGAAAAGAFRAPAGGLVALAFALGALAVTAGAIADEPESSGAGLLVCLLGVPVFALALRHRPPN